MCRASARSRLPMYLAVALARFCFQTLKPLFGGYSGKKVLQHVDIVASESDYSQAVRSTRRNVDQDPIVEDCLISAYQVSSHHTIRISIIAVEASGLREDYPPHDEKIGARCKSLMQVWE